MKKILLFPFAIVFLVLERIMTFIFWIIEDIIFKFCGEVYLMAENILNDIKMIWCSWGKHDWEIRGTMYDYPHAHAHYCKRCGDVKELDHPHAKANKYNK